MKSAERVRQIWATVTLGRWLRVLGSVYITLTDQGKKKKKKQIPAAWRVSSQVNASRHSPCVQTHPMSLLHTVSVHLFGFNQRADHAHARVGSPGSNLLLAFLKRAKAAGFAEYTVRSPCLRSSTPPL